MFQLNFNLKRAVLTAAAMVLLCAPLNAKAIEPFSLRDYNVNINVTENKVYQITESFIIDFTQPRHGIYRDIQMSGTTIKEVKGEIQRASYAAKVSKIKVKGDEFKVENETFGGDKYKTIRIGSEGDYMKSGTPITISYNYSPYDDRNVQYDDMYFNLIGNKWDNMIESATFNITMPKGFDGDKVALYRGSDYTGESAGVEFSVSGNVISGRITEPLNPNEGVTIYMEMEEGYFKNVLSFDMYAYIIMAIILALGIYTFMLFIRFGRDQKPTITVEFAPPKGMNPSEVGYIIDGRVDQRDLLALIIYWADKGYLTIQTGGGDDFSLTKLKDLGEDAKSYERVMFDGLFDLAHGNTVTSADLKYNFSDKLNMAMELLRGSFESSKNKDKNIYTKESRRSKIKIFLILFLQVAVLALTLALSPILTIGAPYLFYLACGGGIILALFSLAYIDKRTEQSNADLGKLLGLKDFIERAEEDRIKLLVDENPHYFYSILPYAYVLDVTDKWSKKFENIAVPQPDWYHDSRGMRGFNTYMFVRHMNHTLTNVNTTMASVKAPEIKGGGGGFGGFGGGFSGGGMGGGGGRSW